MDNDRKLLLIMVALWIVQTVLAVGPLRTSIEEHLVLSLFPYLDIIIEIGNLPKLEQVGPLVYSLKIGVIFVKDAIITYFLSKLRKKI